MTVAFSTTSRRDASPVALAARVDTRRRPGSLLSIIALALLRRLNHMCALLCDECRSVSAYCICRASLIALRILTARINARRTISERRCAHAIAWAWSHAWLRWPVVACRRYDIDRGMPQTRPRVPANGGHRLSAIALALSCRRGRAHASPISHAQTLAARVDARRAPSHRNCAHATAPS